MVKRSVLAVVALVLILGLASVSIGAADFKIGVVTGTVSQGEDEYRGAEAVIQKYPGLILHLSLIHIWAMPGGGIGPGCAQASRCAAHPLLLRAPRHHPLHLPGSMCRFW